MQQQNEHPQSAQSLIDIFLRLRYSGLQLGVGELLDAVQAVEGGRASAGPEALMSVLSLLWCKSPAEERELEELWKTASFQTVAPPPADEPDIPSPPLLPSKGQTKTSGRGRQPKTRSAPNAGGGRTWGTLPIVAPPTLVPAFLDAYWPISRSQMVYGWRHLRRPVPDGPEDVLDVEDTVERAARQGFYLAPVYRRRNRNHAHLVLLLDQGGSMVPFHRFTRDLVETAQHESSIEQVDAMFFNNVPATSVYLDPHLTAPLATERMLEDCSDDTSVLIVSDAGAARGHRRFERIRATTGFLSRLKGRTSLVTWLNPMPAERWPGTSAQIIAHLVPMFQMDADGFANAIDVARGQPLFR